MVNCFIKFVGGRDVGSRPQPSDLVAVERSRVIGPPEKRKVGGSTPPLTTLIEQHKRPERSSFGAFLIFSDSNTDSNVIRLPVSVRHVDDVQPKFLLIDADEQICGSCIDAEGVFVEESEDDELGTVEILGCLPSQRMRHYLSGSKRYRRRNPLGPGALRILDTAGNSLAEFRMGEIINWRPSPLGRERVDLVARCGDYVPSSRTRHVWERWRTARPDRINQWAGYTGADREEWLTIVFHNSRWRTGHPDRSSGRTYGLDGTHVTDKVSFYLAIGEAVNGPGGYFGWNLDALSDCLCGGFGAEAPFTLVWHRSHIARESLAFSFEGAGADSTYFDVIRTVFEEHEVDVVLR